MNITPVSNNALFGLIRRAVIPLNKFRGLSVLLHRNGSSGTLIYTHNGVSTSVGVSDIGDFIDYTHPFNVDLSFFEFPESQFERIVQQAIPYRIKEGYRIETFDLTQEDRRKRDLENPHALIAYRRSEGLLSVCNPRLIPGFFSIEEYCQESGIELRCSGK